MKKAVPLLVGFLFLMVCFTPLQADPRSRRMDVTTPANFPSAGRGGRLALLIGNADYDSAPLSNPLHDVRAFASTLEQAGFEVMKFENLTNRQMDDAVNEFWKSLKGRTIGLFYYSGHGMQVKGENFLLPLKANIQKEIDIKHEAFPAQKVIDSMQDAGPKISIVMLDACRNNPFKRGFRSVGGGLARMDTSESDQMLIAYATDPDKTAADGEPGENSPYMKHILKNLLTPGLSVEKFFKEVRKGVKAETNSQQKPWETSSLTDEFCFVPEGSGAPVHQGITPPQEPPTPSPEPTSPPDEPTTATGKTDQYDNIPGIEAINAPSDSATEPPSPSPTPAPEGLSQPLISHSSQGQMSQPLLSRPKKNTREAEIAKAREEFQEAFKWYTTLVTSDTQGDVDAALKRYRETQMRLKALDPDYDKPKNQPKGKKKTKK